MEHPGFPWRSGHLALGRLQLPLLVVAALLVTYAVLFDQGELTAGKSLSHEVFHDARHLLGVPCH